MYSDENRRITELICRSLLGGLGQAEEGGSPVPETTARCMNRSGANLWGMMQMSAARYWQG